MTEASPPAFQHTDRNLALELVRVTEAAALAASHWMGLGRKNEADGAAVTAMRRAFDTVAIDGTVVIGEGEMDEAPMLFIGERVGAGGPAMDIAVDPLEGTTLTAKGGPNAMAVIALAERGNFLHAPDIYMDKIAVGAGLPDDLVSIDAPIAENLRNLARARKCDVSDLVACMLDRDRHQEIIARTREAGARIMLLSDGDVAGVMATSQPEAGVDIFLGSGGAPEGVLAAAALRCIGGQMQGRLLFEDDEQIARAREMGITDPSRVYSLVEMARGDVMFAATGVTAGAMLRGVRRFGHGAVTHSVVMRSKSGTVRFVEAHHNFQTKTWGGEIDGAAGAAPPDTGPIPQFGVSLSGRRWVWRSSAPDIERLGMAIAQSLELPDMLGRLLAMRGVGIDRVADFMAPTLRALMPDPSVFIDMDVAAERLARAVREAECVAVFGDYDVDGACSAAVMTGFLRMLGCRVLPYVPDRMAEGYGPNLPALQGLVDRGASLVVCVDCGTAAGTVLDGLSGRADVVVLDHHKAEGPPPRIVATVNPNRLDCGSGERHLCAAAIAFLAAVATKRVLRAGGWFATREAPDLMELLDLVALATVCDVMPLTGLNRALVAQGLRVMARRARPGIAALLDVAAARAAPDAMTLGFALGPRINAAGRISQSDLGLRLLLCEDEIEARGIAAQLDAINRQRQVVEADMLEAAMLQAEAQLAAGHAVVVVAGTQWHPGVVGIVAGRIKERFNRPACVAGIAGSLARGSGRSVAGLDLGAAVIAARQCGLLSSAGGHAMAAGFALPASGLADFHAFLDDRLALASSLPSAVDVAIDAGVAVSGCGVALAGSLSLLAPFGSGNEEPMLVLARVRVVRADRVGREGMTIRAFVEGEGGGPRLKVVMFRARENALSDALLGRSGAPLHLVGHLRAEAWNGSVTPSFMVVDAALA